MKAGNRSKSNQSAVGAKIIFSTVLSATLLYAQEIRTPVTREEVWQAITREMRHRGLAEPQMLSIDEINLPAAIPAVESRTLRVSMVCWDAEQQRAQFQMECGRAGQCLPFLAYAAAARATAMGSEKFMGSSCRNVRNTTGEAPLPAHKTLIRVGDHATVFFRGNALNMTALVTCLERGAEGDLIRVRNQDGQIFRVRVFGPARLEAISQ